MPQRGKQKACMDDIKGRRREMRLEGVALPQLHIVPPFFLNQHTGGIEQFGVDIQTDDLAVCFNPATEWSQNTHGAATKVKTMPSCMQANLVEHNFGVRL